MEQHHAPCCPNVGKTYLTIGQDLVSIANYIQDQNDYYHEAHNSFDKDESDFLPVGAMFYTDIQKLKGLDEPVDYGSGIEYANGIHVLFPEIPALQIGLWLNGAAGCHDIVRGHLDWHIQRLFRYITEECSAQKIFLRVGYEFDNPAFGYLASIPTADGTKEHDGATLYRAAFRKLVDDCRRHTQCYDKVDFVWHSWGASSTTADLMNFYPGHDYVDWVGVSLFTQFFPGSQTGTVQTVRTVLDFARHTNHPIMIGESTPFGGILKLVDPWNDWFQPILDLIEEYDIAMWSYIDCDWTSQPMWKHAGFGDTRLVTNTTLMELWQQRILLNPRFVAAVNKIKYAPVQQQRQEQPIEVLAACRRIRPSPAVTVTRNATVLTTVSPQIRMGAVLSMVGLESTHLEFPVGFLMVCLAGLILMASILHTPSRPRKASTRIPVVLASADQNIDSEQVSLNIPAQENVSPNPSNYGSIVAS